MNIFDTVGTLVGLASKTGIMEEDGQIPHVKEAMMSDAIGTTIGSMMGSSTITTYVESASGIAEGGRSGFTSLVTGVLFLLALFFAPLFLLIPSAATTGALVLVGVFMMDSITKVDMDDISEALPAFITMIMMVLTYSIADGMVVGLLCYVLVKSGCGKHRRGKPYHVCVGRPVHLEIYFCINAVRRCREVTRTCKSHRREPTRTLPYGIFFDHFSPAAITRRICPT